MAKSLNDFIQVFKKSHHIVWSNKTQYFPVFLILFILNNIELINRFFGAQSNNNTEIYLTLISAAINLVLMAQVILWQKKSHGGKGELLYIVPTFLLYNFYYSGLFLAGLVLLILPGLYVLVFFSMAPFIAILDDEMEGTYFKRSRALVKKNWALVAVVSVLVLLLEVLSFFIGSFGVFSPAIAMFDAYLGIVLTIVFTQIYYLLIKQ